MISQKDWDQLVSEISSHPYIETIDVNFGPPASDEIIQSVENELKFDLPDSIKCFYRICNGIRIQWTINEEQLTDNIRKELFEYDYFTDINGPTGLINIQTLEGCFLESGYLEPMFEESELEDEIEFKGRSLTNYDMVKQLKPFDIFDEFNEDQCMAFFIDRIQNNIDVLLLTDYYAGWNYSRLTDFESYLRFLITVRGLVRARSFIFQEDGGDEMEKMEFTVEDMNSLTPKFFNIQL
ncbi:MAG: SMI1/KNR4 family protein [Desulfocapsaceae bacterium]|nr:SMI1/KNR4 family protein [Desulfocapsaceae bacterium]